MGLEQDEEGADDTRPCRCVSDKGGGRGSEQMSSMA